MDTRQHNAPPTLAQPVRIRLLFPRVVDHPINKEILQ